MPLASFTQPRFLLCEGDDDKSLMEAIIHEHGLPAFQVCHAAECNSAGADGRGVGGRSGFHHALDSGVPLLKGFDDLRAFLLVSDNDKATSFREVQDELRVAGHTPPAAPSGLGTAYGKPVAVFLIPTHEYGDLEKLCLPEIHRKWPKAEECVNAFLACTGADRWSKPQSLNKARARAAIVGFNEDDPYKTIGILFRQGVLSPTHACFNPLVDFLRGFDALVGIP